MQIPTPDETNDNIVAYWVPDAPPRPEVPFDFEYRLLWQKDKERKPPLSWVTQTRRGHGYLRKPDDSIALMVDFEGAVPGRIGSTGSEKVLRQVVGAALREALGRPTAKGVLDISRPAIKLEPADSGDSWIGGTPLLDPYTHCHRKLQKVVPNRRPQTAPWEVEQQLRGEPNIPDAWVSPWSS